MTEQASRPLADEDRETDAARLFDMAMTPEEYAARHAHEWMLFSFDDYRYRSEPLDRWIQRLGDILFQRNGAPTVRELRAKYLTDDERRAIEERETEEF
jgi:hypothetical protein